MNYKVIWLTGLSGAGKTTIAKSLSEKLRSEDISTVILDGDELRGGLNKNLGFSSEDRHENIRRTAEVAKMFLKQDFFVIVALISPTHALRTLAQDIIGLENFVEVFINTPLSICEERDVKGLYKKAREGIIKDFTGIGAPYEIPINPNIEINTTLVSVKEATDFIYSSMLPFFT